MSRIKDLMDDFNWYLDDLHGDIIIAGITFSPADILAKLDPIGYQEEFNHYLDDIEVNIYGR